jgi:flagellar secretion chaperone FliS
MNADELRTRDLRERVLTASPAQRVVMLYDRLTLDLTRAAAGSAARPNEHIDHALQIVAELRASLDESVGQPGENLAAIYGYLLRELIAVRGGETARLAGVTEIVETLRFAWTKIANQLSVDAAPLAAGAWVS